MIKKNHYTSILIALCTVVLILDSKVAFTGASEGIRICIESIIPSLLPFFYISTIITSQLNAAKTTNVQGTLLLIGYISGYPIGAKMVHEAYSVGHISKSNAEKLLPICNNAGPAFIFGMLSHIFPNKILLWTIWGTQILSSLLILFLSSFEKHPHKKEKSTINPKSLSQALWTAIHSMASVCGWVIIFKTFLSILNHRIFTLLNPTIGIVFFGICELANGCFALSALDSQPLQYILCNMFLSFGGLCVTMQTVSASTSLCIKQYIKHKIAQCAIACTIAYLTLPILFRNCDFSNLAVFRYLTGITLTIFTFLIFKKTVAFLRNLLYNEKKSYLRGLHHDF